MRQGDKTLKDYMENNPFMPTKDAVYLVLRERLLKDSFPREKKINISQLADELQVSRTPICSALDTLNKRGLVYRKNGQQGYYPFEATRENIENLFYVRKMIEGHATYLVVRNRNSIDRKKLRDLAFAFKDCFNEDDFKNFDAIDMDFHHLIVQSCSNHYLVAMYESIDDTIRFIESRMRNTLITQNFGGHTGSLSVQHVNIYYAITMGFASLAKKASDEHIDSCIDFIRRFYHDY